MDELINLSLAPFTGKIHQLPLSSTESETGYFPCLPVLCDRGRYVADAKLASCEDTLSCKKTHSRSSHKSLTPGLFIMNCQHGKHYFMPNSQCLEICV
jgi:hypothetical protein